MCAALNVNICDGRRLQSYLLFCETAIAFRGLIAQINAVVHIKTSVRKLNRLVCHFAPLVGVRYSERVSLLSLFALFRPQIPEFTLRDISEKQVESFFRLINTGFFVKGCLPCTSRRSLVATACPVRVINGFELHNAFNVIKVASVVSSCVCNK